MKDTDDEIAELLMIPKIGRKKAQALYSAGYRSLDDVSNSNSEELAKVPGIDERLASDILSFVSAMVVPSKTPEEKLERESSLFVCPMCGSMVGADSKNCPSCGIAFSDEEEEIEKGDAPDPGKEDDVDGYWHNKEAPQLYMCPGCGALIPADAVRCENCGAEFDEDEELEEEVKPEREMKEKDGFWYKEETGLFMCPNCGAFIPEDANSCRTCGVVFEAEEEAEPSPEPRELACPNCKSHLEPGMDSCPSCGFHFESDDGFWYKDQTSLFICPNCGAFIPETADNCPQCGIVFEGEDVEEEAKPVPEVEKAAEDFEQSLYMCPSCGAFVSGSATKCSVCGTALEEEDVPEEGVYVDDFKLPEIPEEISKEIQAEIEEIELEKLEPPKKEVEESISPETKKGISKDFLSRWEKKEEDAPSIVKDFKKRWETVRLTDEEIEKELDLLTLPDKPEEERLAEIDLKLESDLKNHELWAEKASILVELERQDEAVACLDKAAELNPAKETEYKRRILDILGVGVEEEPVDLAELVSLEEDGEISLEEEAIRKNTEAKIAEIDEKLAENPEDEGLWQEKGELLEKLGRHEEAIRCFDESIKLSYASLQKETEGVVLSLKQPQISVGLTNGQGRVNGWVNGLLIQRGLINGTGKINGMVNGRVNGRGRVNGLVNGLVNGRVNGRGKVNGLVNGGLINGRVNGLINGGMINGQGLINGRGRFYRARQLEKARRDWRLRVSWMVVLVGLVLIVPMFANMLTQPTYAISIDGNFSDWDQFTSFEDSTSDQVSDPDLNILETKLVCGSERIDMFLRVEGTALSGSSSSMNNSVDSIFIFMDMDSASDTGYAINNLGADIMVEIHGWDNNIDSSTAYSFNDTSERNDWNRFVKSGPAPCAVVDSQLEVRVLLPNHLIIEENERPKVMAIAMNSVGYSDATDSVMSSLPASLHINTYGIGADILAPGAQDVELLRMRMKGYGDVCSLTAMNFTINGNATFNHLGNIRLVNDTDQDGNPDLQTGELNCAINWLDQHNFTVLLGEPLEAPVGVPLTLSLFSGLTVAPYGTTIEMLMADASAMEAVTSVNNLERLKHYIGAPSDVQIDGAFGDWSGTTENVDAANDVLSLTYNYTTINKNIDLADVRFDLDDSLSVYLSVSGVMLGGSDIPTIKLRPGPSVPQIEDSDRDRVPDVDDLMPLDFDNDGVNDTDEPNNSIDDDDERDYDRGGTDWWLNTTIPTNFPMNYSGMNVSIYIGPIKYVENTGEDHAYVLIDSDDDPMTGAVTLGAIGADHVIIVTGKGNEITSSELFRYDPLLPGIPWVLVDDVPSAIDWYRMELKVEPGTLGITSDDNFTIFISLKDWKGDYDIADQPLDSEDINSRRSLTGTRAPKPKINFSKTVDRDTAGPGDILTYTIRYACSKSTAYDVVITETYPAGVTFVGALPSPTQGNNQWDIGTLDPDEGGVIVITVIVDDNVMDGDILENYAQVDYTDGGFWRGMKWDRVRTTVVIIPELPQVSLAAFGIILVGLVSLRNKKEE